MCDMRQDDGCQGHQGCGEKSTNWWQSHQVSCESSQEVTGDSYFEVLQAKGSPGRAVPGKEQLKEKP